MPIRTLMPARVRFRRMLALAHAAALTCAAISSPPTSRAQPPSSAFSARKPPEADTLLDTERQLQEQLQRLDWNAEYSNVAHAIDEVFRRNNWDSEADRYARDVTLEVAEIPPWQFMDRLRLFLDRVVQRYDLTPEQRDRLQQGVLREISTTLLVHGGTMFRHAGEIMETRLAGKPFTAEQVARWVKESDGFFEGARAAAERLKSDLGSTLTPQQLETFQRDVSAFDRRLQVIAEMRDHWRLGRWDPGQWGLADDPIHRQALLRSSPSGKASSNGGAVPRAPAPSTRVDPAASAPPPPATVPLPTQWLAHDPDTWIAYLVEQRNRYAYDTAQSDAAESIHLELVARARSYVARHAEEIRAVPPADRSAHAVLQPVCAVFSELQQRLDGLPTSAQRAKAGS